MSLVQSGLRERGYEHHILNWLLHSLSELDFPTHINVMRVSKLARIDTNGATQR